MTFSRQTVQRWLLACGVWFPFGLAMIYSVPVFAMSAAEYRIDAPRMTVFRVACVLAVGLSINLLRYASRPRTAAVIRRMTANWVASSMILVGAGLLSGAMPPAVGALFAVASFTPLVRLITEDSRALGEGGEGTEQSVVAPDTDRPAITGPQRSPPHLKR